MCSGRWLGGVGGLPDHAAQCWGWPTYVQGGRAYPCGRRTPGPATTKYKQVFWSVLCSRTKGGVGRTTDREPYEESSSPAEGMHRTLHLSLRLQVFEDASRGMVVVEGLAEEAVGSAHAALSAVWRGEQHRKVGCTAMNEDSSRSHTLCRLVIEGTRAVRSSSAAPAAGSSVSTATLCLIDLAGSESAKATVSRGQRMEGAYINKSLLTLGTVIHKLAAGQSGHVPFRDSKLTRLLQV